MIPCILTPRRAGKTYAAVKWLREVDEGLFICCADREATRIRERYRVDAVTETGYERTIGRGWDRIVLDEAFMMQRPHELVVNSIIPAVLHHRGQIALLGTPHDSGYPRWLDENLYNVQYFNQDDLPVPWEFALQNFGKERMLSFEF